MSERKIVLNLVFLLVPLILGAQDAVTFEMRGFTANPKADGITDFHGPDEFRTTAERVADLNLYARYASQFWGDHSLSTPLFTDAQVRERLAVIKPQPLTGIRQTLRLENWLSYGYKQGKEEEKALAFKDWTAGGARIAEGRLVLDGAWAQINPQPSADWRMRVRFSLNAAPSGLELVLVSDSGKQISVRLNQFPAAKDYELYVDFQEQLVFLSGEGKTLSEIPMDRDFGGAVAQVRIGAPAGHAGIDRISCYAFDRVKDNDRQPYRMRLVCDENFEAVPSMEGWTTAAYDDSAWEPVTLPSAHGGLAQAGERYYLRTRVRVGAFKYAALNLETLDPAGEVWVNGEPVAVLKGRVPRCIDLTEYLCPESENLIAVCVKPYLARHPMLHSPSDLNIGWLLGRANLILTEEETHISEAFVHTALLSDKEAVQHHRIEISNPDCFYHKGFLDIRYYAWFPQESANCVASLHRELDLRPRVNNIIEEDMALPNPAVWSTDKPQLYKVEVILSDENGRPIDDYVTTTGVRVIEQKQGVLYINHKPEMLNGAQIFGYRLPLETMSRTIRCASDEMVVRDLMMARCLGNMMRIHVHTEQDVPDGINDPRYAEWADQMGLYLIWQSAGWLREGEAWNVDIAAWPHYMRQVYNHPSIIIWEASNHPNRFKQHAFTETEDYFTSIIRTLAETDSTRLLSPTTAWGHSYYSNYEGTQDYLGDTHAPNPWLMHPMMTRGNQDAYTGYGTDWSELRAHPYPWAKSCLEGAGLCYFNYEHEESASQPNWQLARKEPWYHVPSYEWSCEEGSIGIKLPFDQWRASQAFQAFSAWESMKLQTLAGVNGYSWCSLESGPNMFTYQKPLVDPYYVPKLAFYANQMAFQRIWAASEDVDTVYGPGDSVRPVIFNLGEACTADLTIMLQDSRGKVMERKKISGISVPAGRSVTRLKDFRFQRKLEGTYFVVYSLITR